MTRRRLIQDYGDELLAAVVAALFLLQILSESGFAGDRAVAIPAALAFSATLAVRRRAALLPLIARVVVIELSNLASPAVGNTGTFMVAFLIAAYSAGRYTRGRSVAVAALTIVAAIPLAVIEPGEPFSLSDSAYIVLFFVGPFVVGRVIALRRERERDLEGRAAALEFERDAKAREAVAAERSRIARELHDVVAHAISVMVLQARGGRRMLAEHPADTREALDAIERAGEQALGEMRRLLGILRQDDEQLALAPQPSLARIDELVARLRTTGLPVDVSVEGEPFELPPGIDVSAYRIVQEALTNALSTPGPLARA